VRAAELLGAHGRGRRTRQQLITVIRKAGGLCRCCMLPAVLVKITHTTDSGGQSTGPSPVLRRRAQFGQVRAFYLDITQWAMAVTLIMANARPS
jgi:hypothetical protein